MCGNKTLGSKMRQMFVFVSSVGQQVAKTLKERIESGGDNIYEFKDLARRFTIDASSADCILIQFA